jgi:ABC-2 type transport system ATP-binding protein
LLQVREEIRHQPGVEQAVAFGSRLHVSGSDAAALEQAIAPFRKPPYQWRKVESGLEDAFIHLMDQPREAAAP